MTSGVILVIGFDFFDNLVRTELSLSKQLILSLYS